MRVYIKSTITIGRDPSLNNNLIDNRDEPYLLDDSNPGPAQGDSKTLVIAGVGTGGAYQRISLSGITSKYLYIETDGAINVLINSTAGDPTAGTVIPLVPLQVQVASPTPGQLVPPQKAQLVLSGTSLTPGLDLWIQNPAAINATPANVTVAVAG